MSLNNKAIKSLIASALLAIASGMLNAGVGTEIQEFLSWISMGIGAVLIASVITDTVLQIVQIKSEKVEEVVRYAGMLVLAFGLALGADALLQHPEVMELISPFYKIIFVVLTVWLGIQVRNSSPRKF
jgi:hydrogenase/urease accessory protein HupE